MADLSHTHTLVEPIVRIFRGPEGDREEAITELTLTALTKARHLRCLDNHSGEIAKVIALIAQCTGLTIAEVDNLSIADFEALARKVEGFLPDGLRTGETR